MKSENFLTIVITSILIANIINFFFLIISYGGINLKEGVTFYNTAFDIGTHLESFFGVEFNYYMTTYPTIYSPILIIDLLMLFSLLIKTKNTIKILMFLSILGILLHLFILMLSCPFSGESYLIQFISGMIGNGLWIVSYIIIIVMLYYFIDKEYLNLKVSPIQIISFIIIIELILSFFYFSNVNRDIGRWVEGISSLGQDSYYLNYNRLFYSQFEMTQLHINAYSLDGVIESYPYMWFVLLIYLFSILLVFIKSKCSFVLGIIFPLINIVLSFIGSIDILDSFMMNYVTIHEINFFSITHLSFYIIIIFNLSLIILNIIQLKNKIEN